MVEVYEACGVRFTRAVQQHYVCSPRELTRWTRGIRFALVHGQKAVKRGGKGGGVDRGENGAVERGDKGRVSGKSGKGRVSAGVARLGGGVGLSGATSANTGAGGASAGGDGEGSWAARLVLTWLHEGMRIWYDRLVGEEEREWTAKLLLRVAREKILPVLVPLIGNTLVTSTGNPVAFADGVADGVPAVPFSLPADPSRLVFSSLLTGRYEPCAVGHLKKHLKWALTGETPDAAGGAGAGQVKPGVSSGGGATEKGGDRRGGAGKRASGSKTGEVEQEIGRKVLEESEELGVEKGEVDEGEVQAGEVVLTDEFVCAVVRAASVLQQPMGHLLLLGPPATGKSTVARSAIAVKGLVEVRVALHKGFEERQLDGPLEEALRAAGCDGRRVCLLLEEAHLVESAVLERLNSLLTGGDVLGLFGVEKQQELLEALQLAGKAEGSVEAAWAGFRRRVQANLHVVLVMTSQGSAHMRQSMLASGGAAAGAAGGAAAGAAGGGADGAGEAKERQLLAEVLVAIHGCGVSAVSESLNNRASGKAGLGGEQQQQGSLQHSFSPDSLISLRSFSDLLTHFHSSVSLSHRRTHRTFQHLSLGLTKVTAAEHRVVLLRKHLELKSKELEVKEAAANGKLQQIAAEQALGERQRAEAQGLIARLDEQARSVERHRREAQENLERVEPAVEAAKTAVKSIRKSQLDDLKAMPNPPSAIKLRAEAQGLIARLDEQARSVERHRREAQENLERVEPAVEAAKTAVKSIRKSQLDDLKAMPNPPSAIKLTLEGVCLLLTGLKPTTWQGILSVVRRNDFIPSILGCDMEAIDPVLVLRVKREYLDARVISFDAVNRASKACGPLFSWLEAAVQYGEIIRAVQPMRDEMEQLEGEAGSMAEELQHVQESIGNLEQRMEACREEHSLLLSACEAMRADIHQSKLAMQRAASLVKDLTYERDRWMKQREMLKSRAAACLGDALLRAASLAYLGPLELAERQRLLAKWQEVVGSRGLKFSKGGVLRGEVGLDGVGERGGEGGEEGWGGVEEDEEVEEERAKWEAMGLPQDEYALQNAESVLKCRRVPLLVDPSGRMVEFLRKVLSCSASAATAGSATAESATAGNTESAAADFATAKNAPGLSDSQRSGEVKQEMGVVCVSAQEEESVLARAAEKAHLLSRVIGRERADVAQQRDRAAALQERCRRRLRQLEGRLLEVLTSPEEDGVTGKEAGGVITGNVAVTPARAAGNGGSVSSTPPTFSMFTPLPPVMDDSTVSKTLAQIKKDAAAVKAKARELVAAVLSELITRTAEATEYRHHLPVALALSRCARLADDVDWVGLATTVAAKFATGSVGATGTATAPATALDAGKAAREISAAVKEELQRTTAGAAYSEYEARRGAAVEAVAGFVESMAVNAGQTDIAGRRLVEAVISQGDDAVAAAQQAVERAAREGRWVVLCNAHLALSVPRHAAWLQLLLNSLQSHGLSVPLHRDFRLVLTVEAAGAAVRLMPPKLVEACDVLVMEAPAGVKGSMQRSLDSILSLSARGSSQWNERLRVRNSAEEAERGSSKPSGVTVEKRRQGKQQQQMLRVRGGEEEEEEEEEAERGSSKPSGVTGEKRRQGKQQQVLQVRGGEEEEEEEEERRRRRQMLRVRVGMAWVHAVLQERVHYVPRGWLCPYTFMDHDFTWALSLLHSWQEDSPAHLTPLNCLPAVRTLLLDIAYGLKMESPEDHGTLCRIVSHVFGDPKAFFAPRVLIIILQLSSVAPSWALSRSPDGLQSETAVPSHVPETFTSSVNVAANPFILRSRPETTLSSTSESALSLLVTLPTDTESAASIAESPPSLVAGLSKPRETGARPAGGAAENPKVTGGEAKNATTAGEEAENEAEEEAEEEKGMGEEETRGVEVDGGNQTAKGGKEGTIEEGVSGGGQRGEGVSGQQQRGEGVSGQQQTGEGVDQKEREEESELKGGEKKGEEVKEEAEEDEEVKVGPADLGMEKVDEALAAAEEAIMPKVKGSDAAGAAAAAGAGGVNVTSSVANDTSRVGGTKDGEEEAKVVGKRGSEGGSKEDAGLPGEEEKESGEAAEEKAEETEEEKAEETEEEKAEETEEEKAEDAAAAEEVEELAAETKEGGESDASLEDMTAAKATVGKGTAAGSWRVSKAGSEDSAAATAAAGKDVTVVDLTAANATAGKDTSGTGTLTGAGLTGDSVMREGETGEEEEEREGKGGLGDNIAITERQGKKGGGQKGVRVGEGGEAEQEEREKQGEEGLEAAAEGGEEGLLHSRSPGKTGKGAAAEGGVEGGSMDAEAAAEEEDSVAGGRVSGRPAAAAATGAEKEAEGKRGQAGGAGGARKRTGGEEDYPAAEEAREGESEDGSEEYEVKRGKVSVGSDARKGTDAAEGEEYPGDVAGGGLPSGKGEGAGKLGGGGGGRGGGAGGAGGAGHGESPYGGEEDEYGTPKDFGPDAGAPGAAGRSEQSKGACEGVASGLESGEEEE
ncbi:unnamed protein product [Closterium sp. Yama58-4]|nr:unnamed protein product [Closterium sp. Yama58-4]